MHYYWHYYLQYYYCIIHYYWDYAANIRMLWPEHTHTHTVFSAVVTSCWMIRLIMVMWRMELHVVRQWCVWTGSVSLFSIWTWAPVPPDPTDTSVPVMGWEHSWLHTLNTCHVEVYLDIINVICFFMHCFGYFKCKQVCNNEATCTCDTTWAGTDCSMPDPPKEPAPSEDEEPKGLLLCSYTNT